MEGPVKDASSRSRRVIDFPTVDVRRVAAGGSEGAVQKTRAASPHRTHRSPRRPGNPFGRRRKPGDGTGLGVAASPAPVVSFSNSNRTCRTSCSSTWTPCCIKVWTTPFAVVCSPRRKKAFRIARFLAVVRMGVILLTGRLA